ncbi:hypothetical protein G5V59_25970 [Nocardioides sp. W3-2-3]|uniref:hypothetical protein n=1 Tax=Nocardioides convexus TaxID=2712224 RepID=UPI0024186784|nr:hypothetical protein [Nocardioides convexus]NHA01914.1 hypothetical protein [Nocardioides convexus]
MKHSMAQATYALFVPKREDRRLITGFDELWKLRRVLVMDSASLSVSAIRQQYLGVLEGAISREAAADWAAAWITRADPPLVDLPLWDAVKDLAGIDLRVAPEEYLHTESDIREWLGRLDDQV